MRLAKYALLVSFFSFLVFAFHPRDAHSAEEGNPDLCNERYDQCTEKANDWGEKCSDLADGAYELCTILGRMTDDECYEQILEPLSNTCLGVTMLLLASCDAQLEACIENPPDEQPTPAPTPSTGGYSY